MSDMKKISAKITSLAAECACESRENARIFRKGLLKAGDLLAELDAENTRLRDALEKVERAIIDMECSCLPYADQTGEGVCPRCSAIRQAKEAGNE